MDQIYTDYGFHHKDFVNGRVLILCASSNLDYGFFDPWQSAIKDHGILSLPIHSSSQFGPDSPIIIVIPHMQLNRYATLSFLPSLLDKKEQETFSTFDFGAMFSKQLEKENRLKEKKMELWEN